jgi:hypothetical protein
MQTIRMMNMMRCLVKWPPMASQARSTGNGIVRSPGDNVSSLSHPRERRGLAKKPMRKSMNACNPRQTDLAKSWTMRPAKRHVACRWCYNLAILPFSTQPGDCASLKASINVIQEEHGKPIGSRQVCCAGIPTARKGEGSVGKGRRRKQMPRCNAGDRILRSCDQNFHPKGSPLPAGPLGGESLGMPQSLVRLSDGASH